MKPALADNKPAMSATPVIKIVKPVAEVLKKAEPGWMIRIGGVDLRESHKTLTDAYRSVSQRVYLHRHHIDKDSIGRDVLCVTFHNDEGKGHTVFIQTLNGYLHPRHQSFRLTDSNVDSWLKHEDKVFEDDKALRKVPSPSSLLDELIEELDKLDKESLDEVIESLDKSDKESEASKKIRKDHLESSFKILEEEKDFFLVDDSIPLSTHITGLSFAFVVAGLLWWVFF